MWIVSQRLGMMFLLAFLIITAAASLGEAANPVFHEELNGVSFPETDEIGYSIGIINATDADPGDTITYDIDDLDNNNLGTGEGDAYDYLAVDPVTGNVTVKIPVDYETITKLRATWLAGSAKSGLVFLYVSNVNEHPPEFLDTPYSKDVDEDEEVGMSVFRVNADDADANADIQYALGNSSEICEQDAFRVNSASGDVIVNKQLDYSDVVQYIVCIRAEDEGGLSDEEQLVISIKDVQNLPPVFLGQPYDKEIFEDFTGGDGDVLTVAARDGDLGVSPRNLIIYSLIDDANGTFSVDTATGTIRVQKALDRETDPITQLFTLIVQVREDDNTQPDNQTTTIANIYIRLLDVDDNVPSFDPEGPVSTTIPEGSPKGTQLDFGLEAFDMDAGSAGQMVLSLVGDDGIFTLSTTNVFSSGVVDIRVDNSSALDFERIQSVSFQVNATSISNPSSFSVVQATVYLTNINDNTPEFSQEQYDTLLQENSLPGTSVTRIEATDEDADAELRYDLLGFNNDWFAVNETSGVITVSENADFDAELLSVYFLTCRVSDGDRVSTALLNVTVTDENDNAPVFQSSSYSASIPEYNEEDLGQTGEELNILKVLATDADSSLSNKMLNYSIFSGNVGVKFVINSTTGWIFRQNSIDLEMGESDYALVVMATDNGEPPRNGTTDVFITIEDVNDNAPTFLSNYSGTVEENAESRTVVVNVNATDADVNNRGVIYTIEGASIFVIDANGLITLSGTLDYETQSTFDLAVTATDRDSPFETAQCHVFVDVLDVNDESPVFIMPSPSSLEVNESASFCPDCTVLIVLNATDPDTNQSLSYSISSVSGYDENNQLVGRGFSTQFGIVEMTGEVFVQEELDRERVQRFDITVQVRDANAAENEEGQTDSAELVITVLDVNDNAPNFTASLPDSFTIPETQQVSTVISVDIRAVDIDAGVNGEVFYELVDADGMVKIDPNTGVLSVAKPIDRESSERLSVTFAAKDKGDPPLNTTVTRQIIITDVNDNTPQFNETLTTTAEIRENATVGEFVLQVHATDADLDFGNVTYSISEDDFVIGLLTGEITVGMQLDRESVPSYTLTVVASDGTRQSNLQVSITILDVNDNAPQFTDSFPDRILISETALPASSVAAIIAIDADEPETSNSEVRYTMDNLNGTDYFEINEGTGVITVTDPAPPNMVPGVYVLQVKAYDLGVPRFSSDPRTFEVEVTDSNEAPNFVHPADDEVFYVEEDYVGYITTAMAMDDDEGENGIITYQFVETPGLIDYEKFAIDPVSGEINITAETDRETQESYFLTIRAINEIAPEFSTSVNFQVKVNDSDDNQPKYWGEGENIPSVPPEPTLLEVTENEAPGPVIGMVPEAEDRDAPPFNTIYYFIAGGNDPEHFSLDKESREITLIESVDQEMTPQFDLVIRADSDPDFSPENGAECDPLTVNECVRVTVMVLDMNDSPPTFEEEFYFAGLLYTTPFGDAVITVTAIDPDDGSTAVYSIDSQTSYDENGLEISDDVKVFTINSAGDVINNVNPDLSDASYYEVILRATDSGNSAFTDTSTLSVYLLTEYNQVSVIFHDEPDNVEEVKEEFASLMEEIIEKQGVYTNVSVNVDQVDYELISGIAQPNRTEMLLHVVNILTNKVIPPSEIQQAVDQASGYTEELDAYKVVEVEFKVKQVEYNSLDTLQTVSFVLAGVMILILLLILIAFYLAVSSYRRKLRAATAGLYDASDYKKSEVPAPGTNQYAANKNPIYDIKVEQKAPIDKEAGEEAKERSASDPIYQEVQEAAMNFTEEMDLDESPGEEGADNNRLLSNLLKGVDEKGKVGAFNLTYESAADFGNLNFYVSDV